MAEELVLYTNPRSRGRIARWMLEEVGQPYRTEVLDFGTTMKAPAYLTINPMGKVPALTHGDAVVTETRRHLRLSCGRISASQAGAAAGRSSARALLSVDVLHRRPGRGRRQQQGRRFYGAAGARADDGLWQCRARAAHARDRGLADRLFGRRQLHRRRRLCRLPPRLRHDVRHDRASVPRSNAMSLVSALVRLMLGREISTTRWCTRRQADWHLSIRGAASAAPRPVPARRRGYCRRARNAPAQRR